MYLTACGQKGPLYLQTPEEMARQQAQEQQAQQAEQAKSKK
jgi:predicted small lipoprotein YifL